MKKIILIIPIIVSSCGWPDMSFEEKGGQVYEVTSEKSIVDDRCWCYVQFEHKKVGMPCDKSIQVGDSVKIIFKHNN